MLHGDSSAYIAAAEGPRGRRAGQPLSSHGSALFPGVGRLDFMASDADDGRQRTQQAVEAISACMVGPTDRAEALSDIPAAYTYFGQFVFHDVVFSRVFGLATPTQAHVKNAVSFGLDLSGLYGRGPSIDGHLYEAPALASPGTCRFPLGLPRDPQTRCPIQADAVAGRDLPRIDLTSNFLSVGGRRAPYRPLVADVRNDDNLVLSQMTVTLMRAHNRLVDAQIADATSPAQAFLRARSFLTGCYRRTVIHDYLRKILDGRVWAMFFRDDGNFQGPEVDSLEAVTALPIEFTFAASRFAHAMVRHFYRMNDSFEEEPGTLRDLLGFSSLREDGDVPVPANWMIDWTRFIGTDAGVQHARRISPFLSPELARFAITSDGVQPRSVAFMDNWRCYDLGLPSGQAVAAALQAKMRAMGPVVPLDVRILRGEADLLPTAACFARFGDRAAQLKAALLAAPQFLEATPLSYYVLQEASVLGDDGNRLGPVGSYIVGATMAAALFRAPDSEVRPQNVNVFGDICDLAGLLALQDANTNPDAALLGMLGH